MREDSADEEMGRLQRPLFTAFGTGTNITIGGIVASFLSSHCNTIMTNGTII